MNVAPRASSFVTVMAQVSLVLGIAGTVYALVQLLAVELLLRDDVADAIAQLPLEHLPSALGWLMAHLRAIAWMLLAASVGFLLASWGLLRRQTWGWWAFVGFMVVGALVNFAGIALVEHLFGWLQSIRPTCPTWCSTCRRCDAPCSSRCGARRSCSRRCTA